MPPKRRNQDTQTQEYLPEAEAERFIKAPNYDDNHGFRLKARYRTCWWPRTSGGYRPEAEVSKLFRLHCQVIARIEEPTVVKRILDHLERPPDSSTTRTHPVRTPPRRVSEKDLDVPSS